MTEWIKGFPMLKNFAEGESLPGSPEQKWQFYFDVTKYLDTISTFIHPNSRISKNAEYAERVIIEEEVQILPGAFIEGPAYIGKGAFIGNSAIVRAGSFISPMTIIGNHSYSTSSIFGPRSRVCHFCGVSRSLMAKHSCLSAFVITASCRADMNPIMQHLPPGFCVPPVKRGCTIGESTFISAHSLILPGVDIGSNCFIGPYTILDKDIKDNTSVYSNIKNEYVENKIVISQNYTVPNVIFK